MTNRRAIASLVFLLLAGSAAADESDAVRKVVTDQVTAWNHKDLPGFMAGYWKSPELTFYAGGTATKGWDATLARYRKRYQDNGGEMGTLALTVDDVTQLAPGVALVRARFHLRFSGGKETSGLSSLLLRKLPEGWRIVHDHTSLESKPGG